MSHLHWLGAPRNLRSFPTRRSSDLELGRAYLLLEHVDGERVMRALVPIPGGDKQIDLAAGATRNLPAFLARRPRSEEHTSELQSQSNLVCRLLLEKKKL